MSFAPMSHDARLEMLCDWIGAGKAQGFGNNTAKWYLENKDKMKLHPITREWVEMQIFPRMKPGERVEDLR